MDNTLECVNDIQQRSRCKKDPEVRKKVHDASFGLGVPSSKNPKDVTSRIRITTLVQRVNDNDNRSCHCIRHGLGRLNNQLLPLLQNVMSVPERHFMMDCSCQRFPQLGVTFGEVLCDGCKDLLIAPFCCSVPVKAKKDPRRPRALKR